MYWTRTMTQNIFLKVTDVDNLCHVYEWISRFWLGTDNIKLISTTIYCTSTKVRVVLTKNVLFTKTIGGCIACYQECETKNKMSVLTLIIYLKISKTFVNKTSTQ